jgi:hypothetical protein
MMTVATVAEATQNVGAHGVGGDLRPHRHHGPSCDCDRCFLRRDKEREQASAFSSEELRVLRAPVSDEVARARLRRAMLKRIARGAGFGEPDAIALQRWNEAVHGWNGRRRRSRRSR